MKRKLLIPAVISIAAAIFLVMAFSFPEPHWEDDYLPYFMPRTELENSVGYTAGKHEMSDPGKIYVKGTTIYINERYRGIHIVDNSNPSKPEFTGFIVAPGCIDMAIKDNILYLDNAVDFVAFDLDTKEEVKRIADYFPEHPYPGEYSNNSSYSDRPDGYILIGWRKNTNE